MLRKLAGKVIGLILILLARTWRIRYVNQKGAFVEGKAAVYLFWHSYMLLLYPLYRFKRVAILVSQSRDGDMAAAALSMRRGYTVVRGSSSKGGFEALLRLTRYLRSGFRVAMAGDGPKGPPGRLKKGGLVLAKRAGVPVVPVEVKVSSCIRLPTWDKTIIPLPFARIEIIYHGSVCDLQHCALEELQWRMGAW